VTKDHKNQAEVQEMLRKKLNIWEDEENDKVQQKENEIVVKIIQRISAFLLQLHAHSTV